MTIDLDQWLADETHEASGRVFPHDLFLSHRRFDDVSALVDALTVCGANVVWDGNLDLRDRRVMQGVSRAMRRSRFVALFVSDTFEDSPWCRAEYLNALWVEQKYKIQRCFVICQSTRSIQRIPDCLRDAQMFVSSDSVALAQFVAERNLPGGHSTAERLRRQVPSGRLSPDVSLLSFDEQLDLLEQRLSFWAEHGFAAINASTKELRVNELTKLMSDPITEAEIIFREVHAIVFDRYRLNIRRAGIGEQELNRLVRMVVCLVGCYSSPTRALECRGLDKWAYDFVLIPLLLAVECERTRLQASASYRTLCQMLERGDCAKEVPVYLSVLAAVQSSPQNVHSAISSHRLLLYKAASGRAEGSE